MSVAPGGAEQFTANFAQAAFNLAAVPSGVFAHRSGGEDEFVAEGCRNGTAGVEQRFQMRLGGLLKTQGRFAPVAPVRVAAGEQNGFRNPNAVFVLPDLNFRERNYHIQER